MAIQTFARRSYLGSQCREKIAYPDGIHGAHGRQISLCLLECVQPNSKHTLMGPKQY